MKGGSKAALGLFLMLAATAGAQDGSKQTEVPVTIKEVDVTEAIKEFQDFERRLEEYRKAVTDGQKAASDIGEMLTDLRKTASKENNFNEKEILQAIDGYVDGVVGKQADLIDFLQSQRYRITYYANKVAASVQSEDIAALFGTQEGNIRRLRRAALDRLRVQLRQVVARVQLFDAGGRGMVVARFQDVDPGRAARIDRASRWIFPALYAAILALLALSAGG